MTRDEANEAIVRSVTGVLRCVAERLDALGVDGADLAEVVRGQCSVLEELHGIDRSAELALLERFKVREGEGERERPETPGMKAVRELGELIEQAGGRLKIQVRK